VVGTGGLGSLTTFSTFAADTTNLADGPGGVVAVRHVAGTLVLGVAAAWLGLTIAS
jgi:CrcB protein